MEHSLESRILRPEHRMPENKTVAKANWDTERNLGTLQGMESAEKRSDGVCGEAIPLNDAQIGSWYTMATRIGACGHQTETLLVLILEFPGTQKEKKIKWFKICK